MFTSHHFQRHYQNCESPSTPQSGKSHKTCLRGFGGTGSIAWTSGVSHVGCTSNAFKVTMKLQTFLFQMVVTSCISVQFSSVQFAVCLTTGPKLLPKPALHIVRSRASSFKCEYPLLSLRSSNSFLRLLPCLPVTSIRPCIFPSIARCRSQFLRKM